MFIPIHSFVCLVSILWAAYRGGRAVSGKGLWPLFAGIAGFESQGRRECVSLVSVVCCQVDSLRLADPLSREILPSVVCLCMNSKPKKRWPRV